jgi:hypothetical protein
MTLKLMEHQVHINGDMTCQICLQDFGKRKICVRFVEHSLMDKLILP